MGCPCSKLIEDDPPKDEQQQEEDYGQAVSRCKQRKELLRLASQARLVFAKENADYLQALARTGAALYDFCKGEVLPNSNPENAARDQEDLRRRRFALDYIPMASQRVVVNPGRAPPCQQLFNGVLFKPPPPPPGCSSHYWDSDFLQKSVAAAPQEQVISCKEVQDDDEEADMVLEVEGDEFRFTDKSRGKIREEKSSLEACSSGFSAHPNGSVENAETSLAIVPAELSAEDLEKIFRYVHQEFVKASCCGVAVGRMLQSSDGTELGLLGESVKALTWRNPAFEDSSIGWSQAVTLERLSAWELKLYEEVKALGVIHTEFDKKRKLLCKYGVNRVHDETVDKTRAEIKAVETQMDVAIQATEGTAAAIQKITNEELHFQLVELVQGLAEMWKKIHECHDHQRNAVFDLKLSRQFAAFNVGGGGGDGGGGVGGGQGNVTYKLQMALASWQSSLIRLINAEKDYVSSISNWLKASIQIQRGQRSRRQTRILHLAIPEIYYLCQEWEKSLEGFAKEQACQAIQDFSEMVSKAEWYQGEESKARKRVQGLVKELQKKAVAVSNLEKKIAEGKKKDLSSLLAEKKASIESLSLQIDAVKLELSKISEAARSFILSGIETGLPSLFGGACELARVGVEVHQELHTRAKHGIKLTVIK